MREKLIAIREDKRHPLEYEVYDVLEGEGLKFPKHYLFSSKEEISTNLHELSAEKYVCKVMSPKILHKSDLNAVVLNVDKADLPNTIDHLRNKFQSLDFRGVLVVPMAEPGIELMVGSTIDPTFGIITVFGIGGTMVEILKDVTFGMAPVSRSDALEMVNGIKHKDLLSGPRGLPKADISEVVDFIVKLSNISVKYADLVSEIDINPLRITSQGLIPLDARIILKKNGDSSLF